MTLPTTEEGWQIYIEECAEKTTENLSTQTHIAKELAQHIESTVARVAREAKGMIGLLFSGGVDSTLIGLILKKNKIPFQAITIGFRDNEEQKLPDDILQARTIAQDLGFTHHEKIYTFKDVEALMKETVQALGEDLADAVNVGVGSVELAAVQELKKINPKIKYFMGGLGTEEIYAGYLRHAVSENVHEECWRGLKAMFTRDLLRDIAIAQAENIHFLAPFLDEELIIYSMGIPAQYKLSEEESKIILRDAAELLGLPQEYARRPKKAAQYGSRTDSALGKLTKRKGYKLKKEYIDSLL